MRYSCFVAATPKKINSLSLSVCLSYKREVKIIREIEPE